MSDQKKNSNKPSAQDDKKDLQSILSDEEKLFIEELKKQIETDGEDAVYLIAGMSKKVP